MGTTHIMENTRITYTADDGSTWDSEAQCLGWERFCRLPADAEEDGDFADFCSEFAWVGQRGNESFQGAFTALSISRLMRKAMLRLNVEKLRSTFVP